MPRYLLISGVVLLVAVGIFFIENTRHTNPLLPTNLTSPPPGDSYDAWREYLAEDGHYSAKFPGLPQHATDSIKDPVSHQVRHYDMVVAEKNNGATFVVTRITFPSGQGLDANAKLAAYRDELIASKPNSKLISEKREDFYGHPALNLAVDNGPATTHSKLFFVGDTLYLLMVISPKDQFSQGDVDAFYKLFQLKAAPSGYQSK